MEAVQIAQRLEDLEKRVKALEENSPASGSDPAPAAASSGQSQVTVTGKK